MKGLSLKRALKTLRDVVEESFPPDVRLFHYTSAQGLFGILQTNCIWASHCNFLNDTSEFKLLQKLLLEIIRGQSSALKSISPRWIRDQINSIRKPYKERYESFVFSMYIAQKTSPEFKVGSLPHWRSYGRGGGYALQICPQKLSKLFESEAKENALSPRFNIFSRISYLPNSAQELSSDQREEIERLMSLGSALLQHFDEAERGQPTFFEVEFGLSMLLASGLIKSAHFAHENEARLVFALPVVGGKQHVAVFFRQQNLLTIPYIKFLEGKLLGKDSPIERIVIGPAAPKENEAALRLFLKVNGLSEIDVYRSTIAFREL